MLTGIHLSRSISGCDPKGLVRIQRETDQLARARLQGHARKLYHVLQWYRVFSSYLFTDRIGNCMVNDDDLISNDRPSILQRARERH